MFLLYNLLLTLLSPLWVPWMLWRTWRRVEKPVWAERMGNFSIPAREAGGKRRVWFHAVSVGEVVAAMPILRELRRTLPAHEIVLSVTTSSGHRTAREQAAELFDHLVYFPLDIARFQMVAMQKVRPDVVVVMETELWMNFLWAAKVFDARTVVVNGRISDRSFPRSKKLAFFYRALLENVDRCLMQSQTDADRILALGAKSAEVFGNCKFDQALEGTDSDPADWRRQLSIPEDGKPVVVVGSVRKEEYEFVAAALANMTDRLHLVVAPRHLETAGALADAFTQRIMGAGSGPALPLRSKGQAMDGRGILILDTYGELSHVYAAADFVIVGGGFANLGGQNILQPLGHGKAVIHGPHMQNFRDVAALAERAGATFTCETPEELSEAVNALVQRLEKREEMGKAARALVEANVGASRRYAEAIAEETLAGAK